MSKTIGVKAVHDSDLENLLKSLGMLDGFVAGKFKCAVCGCPVDLDNLGSIFPQDGEIGVSCDNSKCVRVVTIQEVKSVNG